LFRKVEHDPLTFQLIGSCRRESWERPRGLGEATGVSSRSAGGGRIPSRRWAERRMGKHAVFRFSTGVHVSLPCYDPQGKAGYGSARDGPDALPPTQALRVERHGEGLHRRRTSFCAPAANGDRSAVVLREGTYADQTTRACSSCEDGAEPAHLPAARQGTNKPLSTRCRLCWRPARGFWRRRDHIGTSSESYLQWTGRTLAPLRDHCADGRVTCEYGRHHKASDPELFLGGGREAGPSLGVCRRRGSTHQPPVLYGRNDRRRGRRRRFGHVRRRGPRYTAHRQGSLGGPAISATGELVRNGGGVGPCGNEATPPPASLRIQHLSVAC